MADKRLQTAEQQKKQAAENLWLSYFNHVLFCQGMISDTERNRIANMIASRGISMKNTK